MIELMVSRSIGTALMPTIRENVMGLGIFTFRRARMRSEGVLVITMRRARRKTPDMAYW